MGEKYNRFVCGWGVCLWMGKLLMSRCGWGVG